MTARQPEEEEYELAMARGGGRAGTAQAPVPPVTGGAPSGSLQARAMRLLALAFGAVILLGVLILGTTVAALMTRSRALALLNLVWIALAVAVVAYLAYERSKLTLGP